MTDLSHSSPIKKILWSNRYCLLDTSSGASMAAREILVKLKQRGWDVKIIGATVFDSERGTVWLKDYLAGPRDKQWLNVNDADGLTHTLLNTQSIQAHQTTNEELNKLYGLYAGTLDSFQPDAVFFYGGSAFDMLIAGEARSKGIATVAYLGNGSYTGRTRWCRDVDLIVTDSQATSDFYARTAAIKVAPVGTMIDPAKVVAHTHERKNILFINPCLQKGAALVAQLAIFLSELRPDINFEVVESRGQWQPIAQLVSAAMGKPVDSLSNVTVTPNQADMRGVYSRARLLLHPSLWWESAGRVIAEAALNAIPSIVTKRGGPPEVMAEGGICLELPENFYEDPYNKLLPAESLQQIANILIRWYDDADVYRTYCERALTAGQRLHNIETNVSRFEFLLDPLLSPR